MTEYIYLAMIGAKAKILNYHVDVISNIVEVEVMNSKKRRRYYQRLADKGPQHHRVIEEAKRRWANV